MTWGSGEIVVQAFRSLSIIAVSDELAGALQVAALLGILFMAAGAAFNLTVTAVVAPVRALIVILLIGGVLLLPSRVTVIDRFDGQDLLWPGGRVAVGPVVIEGVPFGVALPASAASLVGSAITRVLETSMSRVDAEDRLSSAGLWLSARALRSMVREANVRDSTLAVDFRYYMENCTYFDLLADRVSLDDLRSKSAMQELGRTSGGLTSVRLAGGGLHLVSCGTAWSGGTSIGGVTVDGIEDRIRTEGVSRKFAACQSLRGIALAMSDADLAQAMRDAQDPSVGSAALCGDGVFAHALSEFGFRGSVTEQFSELVAIGLLRDGAHVLASQDPRSVALGRYTAQRQRDATYVIAGELAEIALPALRGILEAAVMVLLPLLLVVGLLFFDQFARYLGNGLALVLWLQLWPPVMAVFNGVGQWVQVAAMNEHVILSNGLFTVAGVEGALDELDIQLALSRYMLVLVPMVAWALVRSGEFGGSMLAARLMQPGESAAGSAAASVATNNWSMDQVQLAPRTTVGPHVATIGDPWGGSVTRYEEMDTMTMPANEPGYLSATQSRTVTEALRRSSEESMLHEQQARTQFSRSVENAYESAFGTQGVETLGVLREQGVSDSSSFRALQGTSETIRESAGKSRSVGQSVGTEHTWKLGLKGDVNNDFLPIVALRAGIDSSQRQEMGVTESMRRNYDQLDEQTKSAMEEVGTALEHSDRVSASTTNARVTSDTHRAAMREATSDLESYESAERRSSRMSLASEQASGSGQSVVRELSRDPQNAKLLAEMHRLHNVMGVPFEQAWLQAQEASGVKLDIDSVAARLLGEEIPPMPNVLRSPMAAISEQAENRKLAATSATDYPDAPASILATEELIDGKRRGIEAAEDPAGTEDHYQEERTFDRTVYGPDGEVIMIVPSTSLWDMGNDRITEIFMDLIGLRDEEGKVAGAEQEASEPGREHGGE